MNVLAIYAVNEHINHLIVDAEQARIARDVSRIARRSLAGSPAPPAPRSSASPRRWPAPPPDPRSPADGPTRSAASSGSPDPAPLPRRRPSSSQGRASRFRPAKSGVSQRAAFAGRCALNDRGPSAAGSNCETRFRILTPGGHGQTMPLATDGVA